MLPLAALAASPRCWPRRGPGRTRTACFGDLAAMLLLPPVTGCCTCGVALEAHGQNTAGVLRDGRPVRLLYRDFGGVRVSPAGWPAPASSAPPLPAT